MGKKEASSAVNTAHVLFLEITVCTSYVVPRNIKKIYTQGQDLVKLKEFLGATSIFFTRLCGSEVNTAYKEWSNKFTLKF